MEQTCQHHKLKHLHYYLKQASKFILLYGLSVTAFAQQKPVFPAPGAPAPPPLKLIIPSAIPNPPPDFNQVLAGQIYNAPAVKPSGQLTDVTVSKLFDLLFSEATDKSYVLSPEVIADNRLVSFRFNASKDGDLIPFLTNFLKALGYDLQVKGNVIFVSQGKKDEDTQKEDTRLFDIYRPKYRDISYLTDNAKFVYPNAFLNANLEKTAVPSANPPAGTATALTQRSTDVLLYKAETKEKLDKIHDLLLKLDTKTPDLFIKAYVYEVTYSNQDQSAFNIIANMLGSKISIGVSPATAPLDNFIKLTTNAFTFVVSNAQSDNRFKLLANPFLQVANNKTANLDVGQSNPVLSGVTTNGNNATQGIEYKDSGLIFSATPQILDGQINLKISEEISEVQATVTGVNNTPTFTKRNTTTEVTLGKNDVVMLSGLTQQQSSNTNSTPTFLPFLHNKDNQINNVEYVVFIQVTEAKTLTSDDLPTMTKSDIAEAKAATTAPISTK